MLRRNILIFHAAALGDFVLTWPLAVALGRIYAQSRLIYVTHGQKGQLAERGLRLESIDIEAGWHELFAEVPNLPARATTLLNGAHAVVSFMGQTDRWAANTARINPAARIILIDPRPPANSTDHASEWIVSQLAQHPVEQSALRQLLRSVAARGIGFSRAGGDDVVLHPGSGSPEKCWPLPSFIELARQLRRSGRNVRVLLGEVERERWPAEHFAALSTIGTVRQPATYLDLLTELSTAGVFVGNDSGPGHLAGIIGVPTISIFGPTDPNVWRPLGPSVTILRGQPIDRITIDKVMSVLATTHSNSFKSTAVAIED